MELALPLLLAAMVLIAAGFTMRHARFGKTGTWCLLALLGGICHFLSAQLRASSGRKRPDPDGAGRLEPAHRRRLLALGLFCIWRMADAAPAALA